MVTLSYIPIKPFITVFKRLVDDIFYLKVTRGFMVDVRSTVEKKKNNREYDHSENSSERYIQFRQKIKN